MHAIGDMLTRGKLMRSKLKPIPACDSIQTLIAVRSTGRWQLAVFQNTRLRPMSRSFAAVLLWNITDWLWPFLLHKR